MDYSPCGNGAAQDDPRSYHPPPTPRTYLAGSWRDPERRREVIDYIAGEYDWYIDRMVAAKLRDLGWDSEIEHEICAGEAKKRFLMPDEAALAEVNGPFWLGRWDRDKGPLRNFFHTCIRRFIQDWCDKNRKRKAGAQRRLGTAGEDEQIYGELQSPDLTPAQLAEQREFEARYDKDIFIRMAIAAYCQECGQETARWRAYQIYTASWPQPTMREVAEQLEAGDDEVNNFIHRGRVRVQELLWWGVRALEMDDESADRAILELVGRLPACRERKILPHPPKP